MDVAHCAEMPWGPTLVGHRAELEGMAHKRLFEGEEGSPDNYMLVMSREPKSYFSPRHRHAWDQIRFCLEGKIPIAKGLYVEGGEIAYFPEAAPYGPQEGGEDRIVLLLQFGGASGQGFIGPDRLDEARRELAQNGNFEGGIYVVETPDGRENRDAYEALWLHAMGGELDYVSPAYKTPIVMRPEALRWERASEPGVSFRSVGVFPHRGLTIASWKLAPGARHRVPGTPAIRFLFVTDGLGTLDGEQLRKWSAVRLRPGESAEIETDGTLELIELVIGLVEYQFDKA